VADIKNFEKDLGKLEALVEELESGELSLDEALKKFEQGVKLTRSCQQALSEAELRVKQLVEENGEIELQDLSDAADDE